MYILYSSQGSSYITTAVHTLTTDFQHAYREGHSTSTALKQMTDDWLREIDAEKIVGAVLLDFSAALNIFDHSLLLKKRMCYGFTPPDYFKMEIL